ncbi:MAG TPA: DoxX family membrane protein [Polyangiaceae bacterium]|nr:DoxX family membrane protein [Polyangiaceae bacterium]
MTPAQLQGYRLLRVALASVFVVHASVRIGLGIVDDFSGYWQATFGAPPALGLFASWAVTLVELAGGLLLAAGRFVAPLAAWFSLQLAVGVLTIHARAGWFVVGAGRNGMEYSALIVAGLAALVLLRPPRAAPHTASPVSSR